MGSPKPSSEFTASQLQMFRTRSCGHGQRCGFSMAWTKPSTWRAGTVGRVGCCLGWLGWDSATHSPWQQNVSPTWKDLETTKQHLLDFHRNSPTVYGPSRLGGAGFAATSATYCLFQGEPSNALWWHFDCAVWSWKHSSGVEFSPKKQQLDGWRI